MASPAFRDGGRIVITFNEGSDSAACCGETSSLSPAGLCTGPIWREAAGCGASTRARPQPVRLCGRVKRS
jgi:hypothetical protein